MKQKLIFFLLISLGLTLSVQAARVRIGTIDMNELYNGYYKTQEAQAKFQVSVKNAQDQIQAMRDRGKSLLEDIQKLAEEESDASLSLERRESARRQINQKQQTIQKMDNDLKQFVRDSQRAINESRKSYNSLLLDEIETAVIKVVKKKRITLVFDTSGLNSNTIPSIYYADDDWDITSDVLKVLNVDAPSDTK